MTEQRTVQYQQKCITVTDVSGDYLGLPGTQIPVYRRRWLVFLPGYNTGLVSVGIVLAIIFCSPGLKYQFTGILGVCQDIILVWYCWGCFWPLFCAPWDPSTSLLADWGFAGIQYWFGIAGNGSSDFSGLSGLQYLFTTCWLFLVGIQYCSVFLEEKCRVEL
jgi:hypothetical protein